MDTSAMGVVTVSELGRVDADNVGQIKHLAVSHKGEQLFLIDDYNPGEGGKGRYSDGRSHSFASLAELQEELTKRYDITNR